MLHWLNPPKHKLRKFADDDGQVSIVADIDPLIFPVIDVAKKYGMQNSDIELITDEFSKLKISFPVNDEERFTFLFHIIKLLFDDLSFNDADQTLLSEIANEIGIAQAKSTKLITIIYNGLTTRSSFLEIKLSFIEFLSK